MLCVPALKRAPEIRACKLTGTVQARMEKLGEFVSTEQRKKSSSQRKTLERRQDGSIIFSLVLEFTIVSTAEGLPIQAELTDRKSLMTFLTFQHKYCLIL